MKNLSKAKGFTLIEVMVALAIFAVTMSALMTALNTSSRNLNSLQNRTMAQWLATNHLVGLLTTRNFPTDKEKIEKVKFGGTDKPREWVVRIRMEELSDRNFRHLIVSAGEEIGREPQFYATVDTFVNVAR